MKQIVLITLVLVCCIYYGYKQAEFRTVHGKKANYSISIPVDYTNDLQLKGDDPFIDLEYGNTNRESIIISVADIAPGDTSNSMKQFTNESDSEFVRKAYPDAEAGFQLLERKLIDVNGISSLFVYSRSGYSYEQSLIQFHRNKMIHVLCGYYQKGNDSLMEYYHKIITSIAWDKE